MENPQKIIEKFQNTFEYDENIVINIVTNIPNKSKAIVLPFGEISTLMRVPSEVSKDNVVSF